MTIASGPPLERIPLVRPRIADSGKVAGHIRKILETGILTNGPYVRAFEDRAARFLGVRHCIAVASCTSGLMLTLRAAELRGDVIVPSFTFAATAHAVVWNGLRPVFADVDPRTLTLSPAAVEHAIGTRTCAILATHVYGTPCDIEGLDAVARANGLPLFFDAAHAFGSRHAGTPVGGFGNAEVFSLSPTKVLVSGEGGIVATNDGLLAERIRIGRDYGNPGDYDCLFVGLNARMSEVHAAIGLASLENLEERIAERNALARSYVEALSTFPGVTFAAVPDGDVSTYKDFTVLIEPEGFGIDADGLAAALSTEGIETKRYYDPPVHAMHAYRQLGGRNGGLAVTELVSRRVLTLPLWSGMTEAHVGRVVEGFGRARISRSGVARV